MLWTQEAITAELAYRLEQVVKNRDRTEAPHTLTAASDLEGRAAAARSRTAVCQHVRPA